MLICIYSKEGMAWKKVDPILTVKLFSIFKHEHVLLDIEGSAQYIRLMDWFLNEQSFSLILNCIFPSKIEN